MNTTIAPESGILPTIEQFCKMGKAVIITEREAIADLEERIDHRFNQACHLLLNCKGRIIVTGMGKSGHIANKIAATLASTGSPAFFVHPAEASHGDIGMITKEDVLVALSNSGETPEILNLLPWIKRLGLPLIALTGQIKSTLAKTATIHIDVSVKKEACPLGLAPTASTTAALVMGDALAIALLEARGFTPEDFAFTHPGGTLGNHLRHRLLLIDELMHTGPAIPLVKKDCLLKDALVEISRKRLGMTIVVSSEGKLIGIYTDGDLRRTFDKNFDIRTTLIAEVMTKNCVTISPKKLAAEALQIMEAHKITSLVVVDSEHRPLGVVHMHDIIQAGSI